MGRLHICTSGYSYKDWVGPVYPPGTPATEYLGLYAAMFSCTEINASYYRMPEHAQLARMRDTARAKNPDFCFTLKAHRSITHERPGTHHELARRAETLLRGVDALLQGDCLEAVLLQFPYSFHYTAANRWYLDDVLQQLHTLPLVVEFRNREWMHDSVLQGLASRRVGIATVDQPQLTGLIDTEPRVSDDIAYLRFHGRNRDTWWNGTATTRYDYLYSDAELQEWLPKVRRLQERSRVLVVAFNNHAAGKAVENARRLQSLADAGKGPAPSPPAP